MKSSRYFVVSAVLALAFLLSVAAAVNPSTESPPPPRHSETRKDDLSPADTEADVMEAEQRRIDAVLRAYRRLPAPELARLGVDVGGDIRAGSERAKELMEAWRARQAEIKRAIDSVAKPVKMMETIAGQLSEYQSQRGRGGEGASEAAATAITAALDSLEALVLDVDNARDFHTIGGWRVLVGLLGPDHSSEVRARASWVVGTAVKNNYDFQLWTLEAAASEEDFLKPTISALSLILSILEEPSALQSVGLGEEDELHRKAWYALTAAARGNADVQAWLLARFEERTGREILSFPSFLLHRIRMLHGGWRSRLAASSASPDEEVSGLRVTPYSHQLLKLLRFVLDLCEENRYFRDELTSSLGALTNTSVEELTAGVRLVGAELLAQDPVQWLRTAATAAADLLEALEAVPDGESPLFVCPANNDAEDEDEGEEGEEETGEPGGAADMPSTQKKLAYSDAHRALYEVSSLLLSLIRQVSGSAAQSIPGDAVSRLRGAAERVRGRACRGDVNQHIFSALDDVLSRF